MITNLNFLNKGGAYPPASEKDRLKIYNENNNLFMTKHDVIWNDFFLLLSQRLKKRNIEVDTIFNYHQLLSKKIADFVCGEPPSITCGKMTDELNDLLSLNEFDIKLYESFIDVSKLGNSVFKIVGKELSIVDAKYWFPVADPTNQKKIGKHLICYPTNPDTDGNPTELYCEIHSIGSVEIRKYSLDKNEIGNLISEEITNTGLDTFAVFALSNITHSGSYFGIDDYQIINSIIKKIMWRFATGDKVLDKHTDPSITGPGSALEYDERTGSYFLPLGNYFKRDTTEDPEMKYITWDGNLESVFKEIDKLLDQLYILSEMGTAFLDGATGGGANTGTALKLKMTSPRTKAQRLVGINAEKVKQIIFTLAHVNGLKIDKKDIKMKWKEGLPNDPVERTSILSKATGGKALMSHYSAIMEYNELSEEETEKELERIREDEALGVPEIMTGGSGLE